MRAAIALLITVIGPAATVAGDLTPPAGPRLPTMKTLDEVEARIPINQDTAPGDADSLFRITQPGSYYLTESIVGQSGKSGIEIASPTVRIDLNGFQLFGFIFGGPPTLDGIRTDGVQNDITITNGTISLWGRHGIDMITGPNNTAGDHALVERINAIGNSDRGIRPNNNARIIFCVASFNGEWGIEATNATITDTVAADNGTVGIGADTSHVSRCVASGNGSYGVGGRDSVYTECIAIGNTNAGIIGTDNVVSRCRISGSTNGIPSFGDGLIIDNLISNCTSGFYVSGANTRMEGNTVTQCTTGFEIVGPRNFLTGNLAAQCGTPYDIAANNYFGTIVNRNNVATGAVSGASAASTLGTTDPHANFSR